jgi:hypothetical protein
MRSQIDESTSCGIWLTSYVEISCLAFLNLTVLVQLAEYQEQAYLLDPYLEELVGPVVNKFKFYAQGLTGGSFRLEDIANFDAGLEPTEPLTRVSYLLYNYLKFRGYKTISQSIRLL